MSIVGKPHGDTLRNLNAREPDEETEFHARVLNATHAIQHEERPKSRGVGWLNKLIARAFGAEKNRTTRLSK